MDKEKLLDKATDCLIPDSEFISVFNRLLTACGEKPTLRQNFSCSQNLMALDALLDENEEIGTLLEIAIAICESENLGDKIDEMMEKIDKAHIYGLGSALLYDLAVTNSYVNEYPYIVSISLTCENSEAQSLQINFSEGINRIDLRKYETEFTASQITSAIMWCLRGVPKEVLDCIESDYFLPESAKDRLRRGESATETVRAKLSVEAKDGCFCGADSKAVFGIQNGKIVSDLCTDTRQEKQVEEYFCGLWNNALTSKFGITHGNICSVAACASENRYPVLIDLREVTDENDLAEIISLKNQIIIFENGKE